MIDFYGLKQKIQELYPNETFSEEELERMERDLIRFFTILIKA